MYMMRVIRADCANQENWTPLIQDGKEGIVDDVNGIIICCWEPLVYIILNEINMHN